MILRIIFWCFVIVIGFYIIDVIINNSNLKLEYKTHIQNSIDCGNYVVMSFDSLLNMDRADKKYFKFNKKNDSWTVSHEEFRFKEGYGNYTAKTTIVMQTKKDYKKLQKYLVLSDGKNVGDAIYNNFNDEAMEEIIKHYREVVERNRVESQKRIADAIQTYTDIKNNRR